MYVDIKNVLNLENPITSKSVDPIQNCAKGDYFIFTKLLTHKRRTHKRQPLQGSDGTNVGLYKGRTGTNVGLVQTSDWYKRRTDTNVGLGQTSDWY